MPETPGDEWAVASNPDHEAAQRAKPNAQRGKLDAKSYDADRQEWGKWIESGGSSRVSRFRYDQSNAAVQVAWRDNGTPYLYSGVSPETFRAFVKSASKGRAIRLLGGNCRPIRPQELDSPSP